ncbi:MAG: FliA/WhiG family RNA polymerase sigma factor [Calditrichaeota bacterium]|nr:MAG: FliA/WhiG family RNA polymerase sigma factor [Calditrichota bacterium]MBL1204026.1 FliA/WhiG family RNA polymerase sigma factor [Calditrichota bacterium]NOG43857.1 FliA/WhiG family RNA polymerase sigma factor [Calditrichota bacterium]
MEVAVKDRVQKGEFLVQEYLKTKNPLIKDKIVESYGPLVKHIIGRFNLSYSTTISVDDLYQFGILGLLKALDRYDIEMNVPFKGFVYKRIHGEVIDALRREGVIGRDMYEKVKNLENCVKKLSAQNGREPAMHEICDYLDISEKEYYSILNTSQMTYMTSLNTTVSDEEGTSIYKVDTLEDENQMSPEEIVVKENMKVRLKQVINKLPERERLILALYFYEELILADIGKILKLSEARISQILNKTLVEIKTRFL